MWIRHIPLDEASGRLKALYDRVSGPDGTVDNILLAHSLRPHSLEGHMALYKSVLHHTGNELPPWFLEAIGTLVSHLNGCDYCVEHHFAGLQRLLQDDVKATAMRAAIENRAFEGMFTPAQVAALDYARALTLHVHVEREIERRFEALRARGFDDGAILEVNQVTAYFNYANRVVLGLGVTLDGDVPGLAPRNTDDSSDWTHR